jgi:lipopolysaccharide biosynthesis glycosyltransferase
MSTAPLLLSSKNPIPGSLYRLDRRYDYAHCIYVYNPATRTAKTETYLDYKGADFILHICHIGKPWNELWLYNNQLVVLVLFCEQKLIEASCL